MRGRIIIDKQTLGEYSHPTIAVRNYNQAAEIKIVIKKLEIILLTEMVRLASWQLET